jgi:hypothetical protein
MSDDKVRLYHICFHLERNKRTTFTLLLTSCGCSRRSRTFQIRRFTEEHLNTIMNMRLVSANDKNNSKANIILFVLFKDLLSGSKYGDTREEKKIILITFYTYFLSVINVCRYCIQLLIVRITTLLKRVVVKVLCYKSEGRWFDPRWCQWVFPLT